MALFRRRARGAKAADSGSPPLVTFTPKLIEILKAWDGSMRSYGALYRELAPVRTVVDFLSDAVSSTSLKLHKRTAAGRPEQRDHPAARVIRKPNPEMSGQQLIGWTMRDIATYGVAYWRKLEANDGASRMLVPLPPERVQPQGGDLLAPARFDYYRVGQSPLPLSRDEIVYFRLYNPEDRRIGSSKLEALRPILAEEIEVSRHRRKFWQNAARREGFLQRPLEAPKLDPADLERLAEDFRKKTAGEEQSGKTPILEEGMTWVNSAFSPREAEFIEGRRFILQATAWCYNLPLPLLSLTETATFASQKEFHRALYQDTLPPWYGVVEGALQFQVLPWFNEDPDGSLYFEFAVESKLRGSFEEQAAIIATAVGRPWMTVKEVRELYNMDDRGDPRDDDLALPANNVALLSPEGGAEPPAAPAAALGGPVAALPAGGTSEQAMQRAASRVLGLKELLDRQQRSVLSKVGAGQGFDVERWNRELERLVAAWTQEDTA